MTPCRGRGRPRARRRRAPPTCAPRLIAFDETRAAAGPRTPAAKLGVGPGSLLRRHARYAGSSASACPGVLPGVAGAKATVSAPTFRPWPRDRMTVIGHVLSNVYAVLTHSGVTLAPLIGELVTLELVDGARVELLDRFRPRA